MRRTLSILLIVAAFAVVALAGVSSATTAASPQRAVADAQQEWLSELRSSARSGDRSASFPSPSRVVLMRRLRQAQKLYGFRIVTVKMMRPLQGAPVIVIRSDRKHAIARATPRIIDLFDPQRPTRTNAGGYAYEGYFFTAQDGRGVPYLATFNHWRPPHVGGGEWAADESLYPFPHG